MATQDFAQYLDTVRTISDLGAASAALHWDQETYMPQGAAESRAEQIATIDTLIHKMMVADEYSGLLERLKPAIFSGNGALADWQKASVKESMRDHERAVKLPEEFVHELSRTQSLAQHDWKRARAASDFSLFSGSLTHLVELKRQEAAFYSQFENPYDSLIDLFEPGMTVAQLRPVFDRLKEGTRRLLQKIADSGVTVDDGFLFTDYDKSAQLAFSKQIVEKLGFDFTTGRVDLSAHPFCTSFAPSDVRLTTRVYADDLRSCLFGLIHEAGHGMYEQGIDPQFARTPLAGGTSMGIHESQSLFWENMIGRSEPFWRWGFAQIQSIFPERLGTMTSLDFFRAINVMKPTFIRVEADELTYNLHIILRFEIEEALINGTMEVADIPRVWNDRMEEYLGIRPANDAEGCLQDVHWSFGGFGYFPSYTLGKLYAAMFYNQAVQDIPDLVGQIERGEFTALVAWLREKIHRWGKAKNATELAVEVCGKPLDETDFLRYLESKIERVYARD